MAKVDPRLEALKKVVRKRKEAEKDTPKEREYDPAKQAEGYRTRLEASGIDVPEAEDKRNIIEKALNLKPDQNVLFDIFEIINRPQQALFGAINAAQTEGDFFKGLAEGFTGNRDTSFGQILRDAGMDDTPLIGEVGMDDILGFAGDVLLDPVDLALFGAPKTIKLGGKLVNYADKLDEVADAARTAEEAFRASSKALDAARAADNVKDIAKLTTEFESTKKTWESLASQYETLKKMKPKKRNLLQVATQFTGSNVKKMMSFADSRIQKVLKNIDAKYLAVDAKRMAKAGIQGAPRALNSLKYYNNIKQGFVKIFDWSKSLRDKGVDLVGKSKRVRGSQEVAQRLSEVKYIQWLEDIDTYKNLFIESAKKNGLYEDLIKDALRGRTLEEVHSKLYNYIPAGDNAKVAEALVKDYIDEIMTTIYEHGAEMFGIQNGEIVANITGLSRKSTIYDMIFDDSYMYQMGVPTEQKELIENWLKTHLPEWYDAYVTNGTLGETGLFVASEATGNAVQVWRFNEGFEKGEPGSLMRSLRSELKRLNNISQVDISDAKGLLSKYDLVLKEIEEVEAIIDTNKKLAKSGVQLAEEDNLYIPVDHPLREQYDKTVKVIDELNAKKADLSEQMKNIKGRNKKQKIEAILKESEDIERILQVNTNKLARLKKTVGEDGQTAGVELSKYLSELKNRRAAYSSNVASRFENFGRIKSIENYRSSIEAFNKASEELTINPYIAQEAIDRIGKYANLEGVPQYLSATHRFMNDVADTVNEIMGSKFSFQSGYLPHVITPEWKQFNLPGLSGTSASKNIFSGSNFIGNTSKFAGRRYQTSAMVSNDLAKSYIDWLVNTGSVTGDKAQKLLDGKNMDMFYTATRTSLAEFIKKAPKSAGDAQMLREVMGTIVDAQLNAGELIIPASATGLAPGVAPRGTVEISKAALIEKLEAMSQYIEFGKKDPLIGAIKGWLEEIGGDEILYIDKNINRLIGRIAEPEETSDFLKTLEFVNNIFKKNKLLSPGFQLRNIAGNFTNLNLAGMKSSEILKYTKKADEIFKKGDEIFKKFAKSGIDALTDDELKVLEIYNEFAANGFFNIGNRISDLNESMLFNPGKQYGKYDIRKYYDKITEFNFKQNEKQDNLYRLAAFLWGKENPDKLLEMGFESSDQFVRFALFDFEDLSVVEQDVFKKLIPFYTFTKKNLGFQMRNLMKNPHRYNKLVKSFDSMWDMLNLSPEELDAYTVENFWIPIPYIGEDGKYYAIKSSLPVGDLGEWMSDPFRRLMASTTPVARAPFEIVTNTQAFSGMPIEEFRGQKGFQIPEIPRAAEFALNQLGLDVPASQAFDIGRTVKDVAQGNITNPLDAIVGGLGRTVVSHKDPAATAQRNAYNELDHLRNLMRYYKQEGIDILTLAEINNRSKKNAMQERINRLKAITKRG